MKGPFGFFASLTKGVGNKIIFYGLLAVILICLGSMVLCSEERAQDVISQGFYDPRWISFLVLLFVVLIQLVNLAGSYGSYIVKKRKAEAAVQDQLYTTKYKNEFKNWACERIAFSYLLDGHTLNDTELHLMLYMDAPEREAAKCVSECAAFLEKYF